MKQIYENSLLNEWEIQKKIVLDRKNICFILQDTQDSFKFAYQSPRVNFRGRSKSWMYKKQRIGVHQLEAYLGLLTVFSKIIIIWLLFFLKRILIKVEKVES